jgi:hypothetical protein
MSSHHFVREGQEPALLILDDTSFDEIEGLLEWAPLIIVSDRMLDKVLSWGIRIDAVVALNEHFGSIQSKLNEVQVVKMIPVSGEENYLIAGVEFLLDSAQTDVNLIVHSFDETCHRAGLAFPKARITVFENGRRWVKSMGEFRKWVSEGSVFHLRSECTGTVITMGLNQKTPGMYVAESDGIVSISSPQPIWIGENHNK